LQAAALGKGGEVFILDMGQPVSVLALAQDMIRLSGLEPDKDIEIKLTGIRPGEKLFEELATDNAMRATARISNNSARPKGARQHIGRASAPREARGAERSHEERAAKTAHSKGFVGRVKAADWGVLVGGIEELLSAVDGADERAVYAGLRRLIPEFTGESARVEAV